MNLLYYLCREMASYWIVLLILQYVCSAHMNLNRKNLWICFGLALGGSMAVYSNGSQGIQIGYMFVLLEVTVLIFSKRRLLDTLLILPAFLFYMVLNIIPEQILTEVFPFFKAEVVFYGNETTVISLVIDLSLLAMLLLLRHILIKYESTVHFSVKEVLGSLALFCFSMVDLMFLVALNPSDMKRWSYYTWKAVFAGAFLFGAGYYLYVLIERRIRIYRQALTRSETEFLRLQLEALQEKQEDDEETRRLRHDLKNHLSVIQTLCQEGNFEEVKRYAGQLSGEAVTVSGGVLTGNKVADLVISSKMKTAAEHGISFDFEGTLEPLEHMAAPDICGLLANAYDNALEACLTQSQAWIRTTVKNTRNYTVIQISNSVQTKVSILGNSVPTTKKDKSVHGHGISIMKRIARKYNGNCTFHSSGEEFCVKIVLLV